MKKKLEVEEYVPPTEIADIASRRAKDIYRQWAWHTDNKIETLIVSLYLQGMNDAIDAL